MSELRMPSLGADMDRGTLLEWKVTPGDELAKGDVVAVIDTDKSDIEIETFHAGRVEALLIEVGDEVEVGTPIARMSDLGAAPERTAGHHAVRSPLVRGLVEAAHLRPEEIDGTGPGGRVTRRDVEAAIAARVPPSGPRPGRRPRSSPYARRLATDRGVDLSALTGSGRDGAVVAADVLRADADAPPPAPRVGRARDRAAETRRATGQLMARSKREIPHYYLTTTIDLAVALDWLERANRDRPVAERILPAALLLKATALAVRDVPRLNGWWVDGDLQLADSIDLGVGVSLRGGGLIAPAISAADDLTVDALMAALRDVVGRARAGRLRASDLVDPSITVTNLGDQGVDSVHGVIYPPQVAVVGFGAIADRPWAVDGMLTVRPIVTASLAADHRATDGHEGARFLTVLARRLQEPETL